MAQEWLEPWKQERIAACCDTEEACAVLIKEERFEEATQRILDFLEAGHPEEIWGTDCFVHQKIIADRHGCLALIIPHSLAGVLSQLFDVVIHRRHSHDALELYLEFYQRAPGECLEWCRLLGMIVEVCDPMRALNRSLPPF